jgi:hypothetical protein
MPDASRDPGWHILFLSVGCRSNSWHCPVIDEPDVFSSSAQKPPGVLKSLIGKANDLKELIAILVFFAGGLIWVVDYFATREELDSLDCFTRVNVRRLQADENVQYTQQQSKSARSDIRDQQRLIRSAKEQPKTPSSDTDIGVIQAQIDELTLSVQSFDKSTESQKQESTRMFQVLTGNVCYHKDQRKKILDAIESGE